MIEECPLTSLPIGLIQYISLTEKLIGVCKPTPPSANLDAGERTALDQLQKNNDIHITKADKGDTVVVMTTSQYVHFAIKHLEDPTTYSLLTDDPTDKVVEGLMSYIIHLNNCGVIDHQTANFLLPPTRTRTQRINFFTKVT